MLRLVLALLALMMPSLAAAQEPREPVVITGVIRDLSGVTFPYGDKDYHSQSARLAAWREGDGPVQLVQLWVSFKTDTFEEMQVLEKQFPKKGLIRFEAAGDIRYRGDDKGPQSAEVDWVRMLEPVEDAAIVAAADSILNPVAFDDPELGTFEPHSSIPEYLGQMREWFGKEAIFEVILEPLGPGAREAALAMARMAWAEREAIDAQIRKEVTEGVFGEPAVQLEAASVGVDGTVTPVEDADEGPKLTRDQFQTDHVLTRVSCSAQGYCDFHYAVQNDEWYWSYRATIRRTDDGWFLDGWEFP